MFTRTSRAKRRTGAVVLAALLGSLLALATPASAGPGATAAAKDRLSGDNRYATAAAISADGAWGGAKDSVTVVNGENFPDGLAAAALGDRVLLVTADSIPAETEAELKRLEATNAGDGLGVINVVGGTAVVSSSVLEALDALNGVDGVVRHAGADRYATALAVANAIDPTPGNIVLATGENFPDALAAGPLAIDQTATIVLNQGDSLRADVKAYLALATGTIFVVGGEGVVPASVVSEIQSMGKAVKRLAGDTREETAVAVAKEIGAADGADSAVLVNRDGFADALAAGPFAALGTIDGSIMPVNTGSISDAVAGWHVANCNTLGDNANVTANDAGVYAMGGSAVIADAVLNGAQAATACTAIAVTSATVAKTNVVNRVLEYQAGDFAAGNAPVLTAVAGSAAAGPAGNVWTVTIAENPALTAPTAAIAGTVLTVTMDETVVGMTQATFVAKFNSLPAAAALFTASVTTTVPASVGSLAAAPTNATETVESINDITVVLTFNQPVGDGAAFGTTPVIGDWVFNPLAGGPAPVSNPLPGAALAAGSSTYTLFWNDVNELVTVGTGSDLELGGGVLSAANGVVSPAIDVDLTAP